MTHTYTISPQKESEKKSLIAVLNHIEMEAKITCFEAPDFLIDSGLERTRGAEITQVCCDEDGVSSEKKAAEIHPFSDHVQAEFRKLAKEELFVNIAINGDHPIENLQKNAAKAAKVIYDEVAGGAPVKKTLEGDDIGIPFVPRIKIMYPETGRWATTPVSTNKVVKPEKITACIKEKNKKMCQYQKNMNAHLGCTGHQEIFLILVLPRVDFSTEYRFSQESITNVSTLGFSRVFVHDVFGSIVQEID